MSRKIKSIKPIGWMKQALADVRKQAKKLPNWVLERVENGNQ